MLARKISGSLLIAAMVLFAGHSAKAIEVTYTNNSDFAQGILEGLNYEATPDQLQLSSAPITFKFINVAVSKRLDRGTLVRINAETGEIMGEYWTAPQGHKGNPSRTSVDSDGNVWTANRDENGKIDGVPSGSVVKIGLVIGGIRVKKEVDDTSGDTVVVRDDSGEYLQGPFDYNTCNDRDGDGLIRTSGGLLVLDWKDGGDSQGGTDGFVEDADDECILLFQRLPNAANAQHVSVDANDDVWVGGYPGFPGFSGTPAMFHKLDGDTGALVDAFDASIATGIGCGGFGGLVDENGILWSASQFQNKLLQYNPADGSGGCIDVTYSYGLAESVVEQDESVDVFIWNSSKFFPNQITKIDAFTSQIEEGFPISTIVVGDSAGFEDRGVAFIPADRNVWVAKAGAQSANEVRRFDSQGNLLNAVVLRDPVTPDIIGRGPTGLAVDANGKVWVVNQGTNNVMRIDPAGNDGRGVVDLTISLPPGAAPESYGNMAGEAEIGTETASLGTWTVIADGGAAGTMWDSIAWNTESEGYEREGATITVEAQAADSEDELNDDANYEEILNGELIALTGQYIKIRATLQPAGDGTSPVLSNLVVKSLEEAPGLVCDVDENGSVDLFDILGIFFTIQDIAEGPDDLRDWDGDGVITLKDARGCVKECTRPFCLPVKF